VGYSQSLETVESRKELLRDLMKGEPEVWECQPGQERTVAYQVRECLHIGENNPKIYPGLAKAAKEFSIVIQGKGSVAARPKRVISARAVTVDTPTLTPQKASKESEKELAYGGPQTDRTIVMKWIESTGKQVLHFPEANLRIEELKVLHKWASDLNILMFFKDPMVTLRPFDPELAPYSFNPDEDLP
jgi:hypothetical protein